jgi:hypothetical protein
MIGFDHRTGTGPYPARDHPLRGRLHRPRATRRLASGAALWTVLLAATAGAPAVGAPVAGGGLAGSPVTGSVGVMVTADRACYVNVNPALGAPMTLTGSGFGPGDAIEISGAKGIGRATAASDGTFSLTMSAPTLPNADPGTLATRLKVADTTRSLTSTLVVTSANLAVRTKPGTVKNIRDDQVTYSFSGFTPGRNIYAYYHLRSKLVAKMRFGRAAGPCGTLKARALLYPGGNPGPHAYAVAFESSSHFIKNVFPKVTATLSILAPSSEF